MFKNYFTIAARTLLKNKVFTTINVLGLSIGISASLVICLLVNYHFTFDQFEKDSERIYRVVSDFSFSGETYHNSGVTTPMGAAVKSELTGLEAVVSFRTWDDETKVEVPVDGKNDPVVFKKQKNIVFADNSFMNLIGYEWLAGSAKTAFNDPYQTVLTASNAKLYFPTLTPAQVIGKEIYFNDTITATITGVVKNIKANTDFTFQTFMAYTTLEKTSLKPGNWNEWNNTNGAQQLIVKLAKGASPAAIQKGIAAIYKKNNKREPGDNSKSWHTLQPLSDLHFNADYNGYDLPLASKPTLYSLLAVAAFLLLLGCINFINLTTAYAAHRGKEIGIRKTMGGSKAQLIFQFLSETFLLTTIATFLSVILTPLILKAFARFIPEGLHFNLTEQPELIIFLLALMIVVTLLSGFYPALVLSGYKPVLVLKNQAYANTGKTRNAWLRKSLTVSQFVIAQVFIMGTILVSEQITYTMNKDIGFKKDAIVFVSTNYYDTVKTNKYVFMEKLKAIPEVAMLSLSSSPPSSNNTWSSTMKYKDGKKEVETDVQQKFGDTNYINLYKLKLLAGTNIRKSDTVNCYIINETYSRILGFQNPGEAIGKTIEWSNKQVPIVGVVSDFHQKSLHEAIKPLVIASWNNTERTINIALQPQNKNGSTWKVGIAKIAKAWKEVYPGEDFDYSFFDEDIAKYYTAEKNVSSLLKWATGLSVFISCLGLLGLVMFTTTQRTKEIGVRKVLGASVSQIVKMLSGDFILLVIVAFVIAAPLAYIGMHKWLENFVYHTSISWWIFILSGALMTIIALLTVSFRTIQAAVANPVKSLRTE